MTVMDLIVKNYNGELDRRAMFRGFLAHRGWRIPTAPNGAPTIILSDAAHTPAVWLMSSHEQYEAACKQFSAEAIGPVKVWDHLDEVITALDPDVAVLRIEPGGPIALHLNEDLDVFRLLARGARIERAMAERDHARIRRHDRYFVPYYGVLGEGHNVIALPTARGKMIAAFTATDAVDLFLATGSDENRATVKFVAVDGDTLFGEAAPTMAEGVIVNIAGRQAYGFDLPTCRDIATAS